MKVPFFRYPHIFGHQREEILAAMIDVMERGAFVLQQEVRDFEANVAEFIGAGHAIGVANATDALELALEAAGIGPGAEVILPSHTFVASASAIHHLGATPVPVDCGADHLIDPAAILRAVTQRTQAIMPVQLNGRVADMDAVATIAADHGLAVIEDSSQALGARFRNRCAGTFGRAGVFSFYPAKVLGCFGDGGLVVTSDDELAARVRLRRDHGRGGHGGAVETWGINSRLDNLQAAVMLVKLRRYPEEIERRRELARQYRRELGGLAELTLPPGPDGEAHRLDIFQNYEIEADRRDELKKHLEDRGIGTIIQWGGKAIHQFPALGLGRHSCPATDRLFQRCLMLPMNTSITDAEVGIVASAIREFYGR
ncbi:MAG TPA: DegT/DnrJ/EryC1/StrS family aminotransferase [Opitutaceae bacterium]|nr:DegT/DnrJ/EryC1/StrS family aminotransferase [Opitutaceae bacterium]